MCLLAVVHPRAMPVINLATINMMGGCCTQHIYIVKPFCTPTSADHVPRAHPSAKVLVACAVPQCHSGSLTSTSIAFQNSHDLFDQHQNNKCVPFDVTIGARWPTLPALMHNNKLDGSAWWKADTAQTHGTKISLRRKKVNIRGPWISSLNIAY